MTRNILIIDDDDIFRDMLSQMLVRQGYNVKSIQDGRHAVDIQKQTPFDMIITDILMPRKNGIELIVELKHLFPETPVIAMSGGGNVDAEEYLSTAEDIGASATITKPFTKEELLDVVKKISTPGQ